MTPSSTRLRAVVRPLATTIALGAFVALGASGAPVPRHGGAPEGAQRIATVEGLAIPESARYDPEADVYYVSNVNAHATRQDDNGFISVIEPDGAVRDARFIAGGARGANLHAPKGMALVGDALWVTDVTVLRSFDRRTGAPLRHVEMGRHGALFLNDVTAGPDEALYVSDTGFQFDEQGRARHAGPDRIFRVAREGAVSILVEDPALEGPNGVFWDGTGDRLIVASLLGRHVWQWTRAGGLRRLASGPGGYDGIERLANGRVIVSSQDLPGLLLLDDDRLTPLVTGVTDTGDIGVDTRRNRVAIPRLDANVLELWQLPS